MTAMIALEKTRGWAYIFILNTAEGPTLLTSEPYRRCAGTLTGIKSVRQSAARPEGIERQQAVAGQSYYFLTTARGRVIGCAPIRASRRTMKRDIHSVMSHGPAATVVDTHES